MGDFADRIGTKNAGDLILSEDWNEVVTEIDSINTNVAAVDNTVQNNRADIDGLTERITSAETQLNTLLSAIDTLRNRFRRVTLHTERSHFAFGESGEITAALTAVDGSALGFGNTTERPWIDFVTVWGRLKAANGFASIGGEGDRSMSVQVNAQGIAKVEIQAQTATGVTEEEQASAAAVMQTQTSNGMSIAANMMAASTPMDTGLQESYQVISQTYDNSPNLHFTHYADNYYQQMQWGSKQPEVALPNWFSHDYRTSVMAFVKGDNDPLSAEPNLGSSVIQVTFRDWLFPWIIIDYQPAYTSLIETYQAGLIAAIGTSYMASNQRIKNQVAEIVNGKGILAQQRDLRALDVAMDGLNMPNPPQFLPEMMIQMQGSIRVQKAMSILPESGNADAIALFAEMDSKSVGSRESFETDMKGFVTEQMGEVRNKINTEVRASQQQLRDDIFSDTSNKSLNAMNIKIDSIENVVAGLEHLDTSKIIKEITRVEGFNQRLMVLENVR